MVLFAPFVRQGSWAEEATDGSADKGTPSLRELLERVTKDGKNGGFAATATTWNDFGVQQVGVHYQRAQVKA